MSSSSPPPSIPAPPHSPDLGTGYCDVGVDPPCLYGMNIWVWIGLITGFSLCLCGWCCFLCRQYRRGNTPSQLLHFAEAVMSAAHSYPDNSRMHGRASSSYPCIDLIEAQNCCCCLPLSLGLLLLGCLDATRVGLGFAYAADGIVIYTQTAPDALNGTSAGGATATYAGLMVPALREAVESFLWPILIAGGIKLVLWLLVALTICCELSFPVFLLLLWLPVDFGFTIVFAVFNSMFAAEMCQVDLKVYQTTQHVGARRNYLANLPPGPLLMDPHGVPDVCNTFWRQEVAIAAADCVGCFILAICIFYIGRSRMRSWERASGAIKNSAFASYKV